MKRPFCNTTTDILLLKLALRRFHLRGTDDGQRSPALCFISWEDCIFFLLTLTRRNLNEGMRIVVFPVGDHADLVLDKNQHTRELISARNTSHKHNNKDLSFL